MIAEPQFRASTSAEMDTMKCLPTETAAELDALLTSILDRTIKGEL
jgi:hypothetical protein